MQKKREIRVISLDEWNKLNGSISNLRDKLLINTAYYTGCTVSELTKIKVKDIDFVNAIIHFPAENTKSKQERFSRIPPSLCIKIKEYLEQQNIYIDPIKDRLNLIFQSNKQDAITENRVRQLVKKYAKDAGIQHAYSQDSKGRPLNAVTVHTLRHSHIKHAIDKNIPLQAIMRQVGHVSVRTTKQYLDSNNADVKKAYDNSNFDSGLNFNISQIKKSKIKVIDIKEKEPNNN